MSDSRLVAAVLSFADGVPYAQAFGDVYHSADGGLDQARHVFLGGNGLPERWRGQGCFTVLETGFGLGLNFLATWAAWRQDADRSVRLHYVAIEKHPFCADDLVRLHALWPALAEMSTHLRAVWPPLISGFHRLLLDEGRVVLTLAFGDIAEVLPQIDAKANAFYLDGFAPSKNPGMWSPKVLTRLNRLAAPAATLATYTVASGVRSVLAQAGFACEKRPGFGRKREMLCARFAPRWQVTPRRSISDRRAIVIGAGVAGSAVCERLAARGWQVTLIERHAQPAQEASGNLAGIAMPLLSKDDNLASRLMRSAYLFTVRHWAQLGGIGKAFAGEACGVLQLAPDAAHARAQRDMVAAFNYPPDFVHWLDAPAVAKLTANPDAHGAWLFPRGGWVTPSSLCEAMLAACGDRVERHFARGAVSLDRDGGQDGEWHVHDAAGNMLAQAPVLILANGTNAISFPQTQELPLASIRGQVTHVPGASLPQLPHVLCGDGYVTRPAHGICCVGASYDVDSDPSLRQSSHEENLRRLAQMLPQAMTGDGHESEPYAGRVAFRCASPDRLPLVGALPDTALAITGSRLRDVPRLPGLYGLLAYGSRGLIWASFAAELLASSIEGEALPIEQELVDALDPARFALKGWRRERAAAQAAMRDQHAEDA